MNSLKLKTGDTVMVISGKDKGKKGKIVRTIPSEGRVIVEGVNIATHHEKPRKAGDAGGIIKREAPLHACKVMLIDPKSGKPTRIRMEVQSNGEKVRIAKRSGQTI